MTSYTASQVESAIEHLYEFEGWSNVKGSNDGTVVFPIELDGETVPVTKLADFGGEGKGDELWVVVQVGTQFFEKSGYYASHYGSEWDGEVVEVSPVEKTVTVYEAV